MAHAATPPVVVVGPASWNTIVRMRTLPDARPQTLFAEDSWWTVGGTAAGKALHLVDRGVPVLLATVIGADADGALVEEALHRAAVPFAAERVAATERHLNLMTAAGARISIYLTLPAAPQGPLPDAVRDAVADAQHVVLDLSERSRSAIPAARASGALVWTDLHDYDGEAEYHRDFLDAADAVFLTHDALGDPRPFLERVVAAGKRLAVCTRGAQGAVALDADGRWYEVAAEPVDVVDANGAGDAFFAGFLAATVRGMRTEAALRAAARQAARALSSRHLSPLLEG